MIESHDDIRISVERRNVGVILHSDGIFGLFIVFKKYSVLIVTFMQKFIRIQIRTRTYE